MSEPIRQVLVVDDHADSRELLGEFLETQGLTITYAVDGQDALDKLPALIARKLPTVVLLDLNMPRVTGWQFCEIRAQRPDLMEVPVIVVSAQTTFAKLPAGVQGFFPKPVDLDELHAVVKRTLAAA